jgi:hypothetical protein
MPSRKKYQDFCESEPATKQALQGGPGATRDYVGVTCPHCKVEFVQIPVDCLASKKASKCKTHLDACDAAKAAGVKVAPLVRRGGALVPTSVTLSPLKPAALVAESGAMALLRAELMAKIEGLEAKSASTEATLRLHESVFMSVLPSLALPIHANTGALQLTEAFKVDIMPRLLPPEPPLHGVSQKAEYVGMAEKLVRQEEEIDSLRQNLKRSLDDNREHVRTIRWFEKKLNENRDSGLAHMLLNAYHNRQERETQRGVAASESKRVRFDF